MRLFLAVDLPDDVRSAIAADARRIAREAGRSAAGVRWVRPDQLHLTIAFLGEVDPQLAAAIVGVMGEPLEVPPFPVTFSHVGVFPSHGPPHVLWVGLSDGASALRGLHAAVTARLAALGLAADPRPFEPHLTIGRWKQARASDRTGVLVAADRERAIGSFEVRSVALFESRLLPEGAVHTILARAPLAAPATG
jgi:RNA 2',3'-cyclic 3'-phosphodiesterase